jgi:hypothetical protein
MKSNEIVKLWNIRLVKVDKCIANLCRDAEILPSLITNWKQRKTEVQEITILQKLENLLEWQEIEKLVMDNTELSHPMNTFTRAERVLMHYENPDSIAIKYNQ